MLFETYEKLDYFDNRVLLCHLIKCKVLNMDVSYKNPLLRFSRRLLTHWSRMDYQYFYDGWMHFFGA